jgi:hypothetical protein
VKESLAFPPLEFLGRKRISAVCIVQTDEPAFDCRHHIAITTPHPSLGVGRRQIAHIQHCPIGSDNKNLTRSPMAVDRLFQHFPSAVIDTDRTTVAPKLRDDTRTADPRQVRNLLIRIIHLVLELGDFRRSTAIPRPRLCHDVEGPTTLQSSYRESDRR